MADLEVSSNLLDPSRATQWILAVNVIGAASLIIGIIDKTKEKKKI